MANDIIEKEFQEVLGAMRRTLRSGMLEESHIILMRTAFFAAVKFVLTRLANNFPGEKPASEEEGIAAITRFINELIDLEDEFRRYEQKMRDEAQKLRRRT